MLVGISVKEVVLDVVPVCVKDVMGQPASVKKTNASVTRDAVLQQQSAVVIVSYSILTIKPPFMLLYNSKLCLWTIVCLWG